MTYEHIFNRLKSARRRKTGRGLAGGAVSLPKDGQVKIRLYRLQRRFQGGAAIVTVGDSLVTQEYADENHFVVNLADPYIVHDLSS